MKIYRYRVWYKIPSLFGDKRILSTRVDMPQKIGNERRAKALANVIADATIEDKDAELPECVFTRVKPLGIYEGDYPGGFCVLIDDIEQPQQKSNQKSLLAAIDEIKVRMNPKARNLREAQLMHTRRINTEASYRQQYQSALKKTGELSRR